MALSGEKIITSELRNIKAVTIGKVLFESRQIKICYLT